MYKKGGISYEGKDGEEEAASENGICFYTSFSDYRFVSVIYGTKQKKDGGAE